jgi:nucleoside-diphosphate-sugar epimerase
MKFTIFGGKGFIGQNLSRYLEGRGHKVWVPSHSALESHGQELGNVIYAIGLTGDFRSRPIDTVNAHVCKLIELLTHSQFDSWLYLSSSRVYSGLPINKPAREDMALCVNNDLDGLYNISKLMGESICLSIPNKTIKIVRLSNVYGLGQSRHTFLGEVIDEIVRNGKIIIQEAADSEKDYIALNDVLPLLESIAISGKKRIYNVASGQPLRHDQLANKLIALTGCEIQFKQNAVSRKFPLIDISQIQSEFGFIASKMDMILTNLIEESKMTNETRGR